MAKKNENRVLVALVCEECKTQNYTVSKNKKNTTVITVGASGGAGFLNESRFKAIYGKMIDGVRIASPGTKVIVQSIYPLSDKSVKYYKKLTKQAVSDANEWIGDVCRERGVPYLDVHSLLAGDDGYLRPEYQNDEYLHLTAAAYAVILNNLRSYLVMHKDTYT